MQVENDILDLIRDLPSEINDASTTTEMKFLTVGGSAGKYIYLKSHFCPLKKVGLNQQLWVATQLVPKSMVASNYLLDVNF